MPNPLTCRRCRQRKVRCDRLEPSCRNCQERGLQCIYDSRRRRAKKFESHRESAVDAIANLEKRVALLEKSQQDGSSRSPWSEITSVPVSTPTTPSMDTDASLLSNSTYSLSHVVAETVCLTHTFFQNRHSGFPERIENVLASLRSDITQAEHSLRALPLLRSLANVELPSISDEKTRELVELYLSEFSYFITADILDKDFLLTIPLLLDRPYVRLSTSSQIVYYIILYYGCQMGENRRESLHIGKGLLKTILHLARSWEDENVEVITTMDLGAAFLLSDMIMQYWDVEESWFYFSRACSYANTLGYFELDQEQENTGHQDTDNQQQRVLKDDKRYFFWQLVQINCFYYQHFRKPLIIPLTKSAVKFPAFLQTEPDDFNQTTRQFYVIVSLRINFVTLRRIWYEENKYEGQESSLESLVTELQEEISMIISDWNLWSRLHLATNRAEQLILVDLLFQCYCTIMFLEEGSQQTVNQFYISEKALEAAQALMETAHTYLDNNKMATSAARDIPWWMIGYVLFPLLKSALVLYRSILSTRDTTPSRLNLSLLVWLSQVINAVPESQPSLAPLAILIRALVEIAEALFQ